MGASQILENDTSQSTQGQFANVELEESCLGHSPSPMLVSPRTAVGERSLTLLMLLTVDKGKRVCRNGSHT